MLDVAAAIREHEVAVVAPTSEPVLAQAGDNHGGSRTVRSPASDFGCPIVP